MTDQSSVLRFVEDNWLGGERVGEGSFDALAGPINNMFDFNRDPFQISDRVILDPSIRRSGPGLGGFGFGR